MTDKVECSKCGRSDKCCTCSNSCGQHHPDCSIYEAAASIADCVDEMLDAHHFGCSIHYQGQIEGDKDA